MSTGALEAPTRSTGPAGAKAEADPATPRANKILRENMLANTKHAAVINKFVASIPGATRWPLFRFVSF